MIRLQQTILLFCCVLTVSCGQSRDYSPLNVIGGVPTNDPSFAAVVAIVRDELTVCSGTMIARDLVLTAAHCLEKVKQSGATTMSAYKVVLGPSVTDRTPDTTFDILETGIHPRFWNDHRGAFDYAWIRLRQPVSGVSFPKLPLNRRHGDRLLRDSPTLVIAGFGLSSLIPPLPGEPPKLGIKRVGKSPINYRSGVEVFAGNREIDSCTGDSGGPAFIKEQDSASDMILIGVTSRGPMPCASDYEAGAYGLTSEALCWLRSSASYRSDDPILGDFCVRDSAQGASTDDDAIIREQNFVEACTNPGLSEASRHDLMQLFDVAVIPADTSRDGCSRLNTFLSTVKDLNISSRHMRQLTWLRHATNLETLDASDNMLQTVRGLESLKHLKRLDVRNNAITNIRGLRRLAAKITVFGANTQLTNIDETTYREIAELGAAAGNERRSMILALRDILVAGDIKRKSRDLALKRELNLERRNLRSVEGLSNLENLEELNIVNNKGIKDWSPLLTLPRLRWLRYSLADGAPSEVLDTLSSRGTKLVALP
jgi:Leucine-rich repeat (LRR) protein